MQRDSTLTIEHLRNVYVVAADHPAPEDARARLDRLALTEAVDACRRRLAPLLQEADPSVWLIRSIDVHLAIDASPYAAERAGAAWGEQLGKEIQRVLNGDSVPGSVLRFRDHPDYVVQWARDMAAGSAWEKWYYGEFESLRSLPQGAAIAEGILREGEAAEQILMRLRAQHGLEPILSILSNADAGRLYDAVLPEKRLPFPGKDDWTPRLLAVWNTIGLGVSSGFHDALRIFTAAKAEWPAAGGNLRQDIDSLLKLRRALGASSSGEISRTLRAMLARQAIHTPLQALEDTSLLDFVRRASGGDPEWLDFAAGVLSPGSSTGGSKEESFLSELGGIFLLANSFADLQIDDALRSAASTTEEPSRAEPVLRYLLAARCLGHRRCALAIGDPAVAMFAGLQRIPRLDEMARILSAADERAAMQVVIRSLIGRIGQEDDPGSDEHLDFFAISRVFPELGLDAGREQAWSRIAAALLRNFARRLPGFGGSSPEYLFQNFLAGTSQVRATEGQVEVRLPQSPLAIVLRIAGMYRTVASPWREGGEICLPAPPG